MCVCRPHVSLSSKSPLLKKDTGQTGSGPFQQPHLQIQSHSEALGLRASTYQYAGDTVWPRSLLEPLGGPQPVDTLILASLPPTLQRRQRSAALSLLHSPEGEAASLVILQPRGQGSAGGLPTFGGRVAHAPAPSTDCSWMLLSVLG